MKVSGDFAITFPALGKQNIQAKEACYIVLDCNIFQCFEGPCHFLACYAK